MTIQRETISATSATGGAGTATTNATSTHVISGLLLEIYLAYLDSPPSTSDVTIVEATNSPARTLLTVTNANTDGWFAVRGATVDATGTAITGGSTPVAVSDYVKVTIAQANNADGVTATIVWDDLKD